MPFLSIAPDFYEGPPSKGQPPRAPSYPSEVWHPPSAARHQLGARHAPPACMEHRGSPSGYVLVIGGRLTALEELDLPYTFHHVQVWKGEQFTPECKAINPNSKVPGIVDSAGPDGAPFALFESGAILTYLAEKCGVFLPASGRERYEVLAWLTFQVAGLEIREISEASRLQATPNDIDRIFGRGTFTRANE